MAAQTIGQPRSIPGADLRVQPPTTDLRVQPPTTDLRVQPPTTNQPVSRSVRNLRSIGPLGPETTSPVNQNGSFEFDRIVKAGEVLKRTRKTKAWKTVHLVLRPNLLSIYREADETRLRHQVNLSDLTAVARQRDPKRREKHVFGLFSPSRNFHLEASSDAEAQDWVENIRREARIDEDEEEMLLSSPGGAKSAYHGFERSMDAHARRDEGTGGGYSSSDAEAFTGSSYPRTRGGTTSSTAHGMRRPSHVSYSGAEGRGSYSDFSDSGYVNQAAARLSALSLSHTDGRPSTSSYQPPPQPQHSIYGSQPMRPPMAQRNPSQLSALNMSAAESVPRLLGSAPAAPEDPSRVIYQTSILLLKSKHSVRQWKKVWMVLRPRALGLYKDSTEYQPKLILPFSTIIDAVEINPVSKSKQHCLQVITEERSYRFCATDDESLNRWLGAFKSLLAKRKVAAANAAAAASAAASAGVAVWQGGPPLPVGAVGAPAA